MAHLGAPILVDGSHGEGGGALLRTALCMAALTQQPLRLDHVRGGTQFAGLDAEDLMLIRALAESCAAELSGVDAGSTSFSFLPTRRPQGLSRKLESDVPEGRRGGNALVVLHALMPVLARAGAYSSLEAEGETYGHRSLAYDYFANVTVPAHRKLGLHSFPDLHRAGFGREARGRVSLDVEPSALVGLQWEDRGRLIGCRGVFAYANLGDAIAERGISHLRQLGKHAGLQLEVDAEEVRAERPGIHLTLWAAYERGFGGSTAMGARGVKVETLAQTAFEELFHWMRSDATVDPYLADQLLVAGVLSEGGCSFKTSRLTQRFLTSVWVIKQFLPIHLTVRGVLDGPGAVSIRR